jgi:hypothetical protein
MLSESELVCDGCIPPTSNVSSTASPNTNVLLLGRLVSPSRAEVVVVESALAEPVVLELAVVEGAVIEFALAEPVVLELAVVEGAVIEFALAEPVVLKLAVAESCGDPLEAPCITSSPDELLVPPQPAIDVASADRTRCLR